MGWCLSGCAILLSDLLMGACMLLDSAQCNLCTLGGKNQLNPCVLCMGYAWDANPRVPPGILCFRLFCSSCEYQAKMNDGAVHCSECPHPRPASSFQTTASFHKVTCFFDIVCCLVASLQSVPFIGDCLITQHSRPDLISWGGACHVPFSCQTF
jgi:hypothetical protein